MSELSATPDGAVDGRAREAVTSGAMPRAVGLPADDDAQLVAGVLANDRKAAAELVARHVDVVYAYVRRRLNPRIDLVDDLVQEIFLAVLRGLDGFAGRASLRAWILGIARRRVADHYRMVVRRDEVPADDEDFDAGPVSFPELDADLDRSRLKSRATQILAGLPEAYAFVLMWRYWHERSIREIAEETGRTEKAIERLLARARTQFKRQWEARQVRGTSGS